MYNCSYCGRIYEKTINNIRRKNVNNKFIQFAVILDNELVSLIAFHEGDELNQAVFNSNPTFVEVTNMEVKPFYGFKWDGKEFTAPEEN